MYNRFTTYYSLDKVPVNKPRDLIEADYLGTLEEKLKEKKGNCGPANVSCTLSHERPIGVLLSAGLIFGGAYFIKNPVSRYFGLALFVGGLGGLCYNILIEYES